MNITIWSGVGLLGVALYLAAYGALQLGLLRGRSATYTILNLLGAAAVLVSLTEAFNLFSAMIQVLWITLSLIGLGRLAWMRSQWRFSEEESAFLARHFASLPPHLARRFLHLGRWQKLSAGTVLTRQGAPVHELVYFARGAARVEAHGTQVAEIGPGALIGELSIMHGSEATADVEISAPSRVFSLPRAALVREMEIDHDFALAVAGALQIEAQRKIDGANRAKAQALRG